jgi:hypothetical protein
MYPPPLPPINPTHAIHVVAVAAACASSFSATRVIFLPVVFSHSLTRGRVERARERWPGTRYTALAQCVLERDTFMTKGIARYQSKREETGHLVNCSLAQCVLERDMLVYRSVREGGRSYTIVSIAPLCGHCKRHAPRFFFSTGLFLLNILCDSASRHPCFSATFLGNEGDLPELSTILSLPPSQ